PFLDWVTGWLFSAVIVTLLLCIVAHYLNGGIRPHSSIQRVSRHVKAHLSVLLAVLALVEGASYYLQRLALVLSTRYKILDGATYTAVHATRPALVLLIAISVIAAGLFLYNVRQQGWLLPAVAVALWGLVWLLVDNIYPAIIQAVVVNPAQNVKELPYLQYNIKATTSAYGLSNVQTSTFQGNSSITASQLTGRSASSLANRQSVGNIPLLQPDLTDVNSIFTKYEGYWGYYSMSGPSTDRYVLPRGPKGQPQETQVLVSARELNPQGAPSSWVNQHLQFTHGYGAVVTPSNQSGIATGGTPNFSLASLPPSGVPSVNGQPRIYFDDSSQSMGGYVIAGSDQPEVDYEDPQTRNEITNRYNGSGGVPAGGILRRLAFSLSFANYNILISSQVSSSSRLLYYRNVLERVEKAAPFLSFDGNPYPTIVNGRIYWIIDGYTTSDNFPYAEQADTSRLSPSADPNQLVNQQFNYIRNSVKAVVDAYNGTVWFFVLDPQDPVLQTYERAFPELFKPMSDAEKEIPGITSHWRYPADLFTVQTNMWVTYHQPTASVFYTNAQRWSIAENRASGLVGAAATTTVPVGPATTVPLGGTLTNVSPVMPSYELVALPGQTYQSFVLLQPFVPYAPNGDKQNLTAFMVASCDYPNNYGNLTVYTIPAGQTVDGPYLVDTEAETAPAVSQIVTLLDAAGSRAVLGSVVITPIGQSLLFTVPLYVEQASNAVPSLDDVIVVYNRRVFQSGTADPTLSAALCQVTNPGGAQPFADYCQSSQPPTTSSPPTGPSSKPVGATTVPSTSTSVATTTKPTATTAPSSPVQPAPHEAVAQYLATAEQDFAYAEQALRTGDLGAYQNDIRAAEAAVALAYKQSQQATTPSSRRATTTTSRQPTATRPGGPAGSGSPTTTSPRTTTAGPAGTTTTRLPSTTTGTT
ncbi:MAG TPA: UPF0182 family protein, partial [Acidimicrobiales bacterium]|nr:UPF0182 family protein [Acidimicrobiales bacterium]